MFPCPVECVTNYTQDNRKKKPNLTFLGNEPAFLLPNPTNGLTTLCWDLQALEHSGSSVCCPPVAGSMQLTPRGGVAVAVPSGSEMKGCLEFATVLADNQDIIMTYTDCDGVLQTIVAGTNFIGYNCEPQAIDLPKLCTHWVLQSCPICPCDCNIPFNISVDLGNGPVVIGVINRRGRLVVTDDDYKPINGQYTTGYYQATGSACNGEAFIYISFEPGLAAGSSVTATIDGQTYNFSCGIDMPGMEFCGGDVDIAGVCQDGGTGGGGGGNPVIIQGINGTTVTEGPPNTFIVSSVDFQPQINTINTTNNNQQTQINNAATDITAIQNELLADVDFQQVYTVGNWVNDTVNPLTAWMLVVTHGQTYPVGTQPQFKAIETATGVETTFAARFTATTIELVTTKIPDGRLGVTVNVEHYEINNPL